MRAITVIPGQPDSLRLKEIPEPAPSDEGLLVAAVAIGICGTDAEIIHGGHGDPPDGRADLVLGHESLGKVLRAPADSGFAEGDLVAGIVRRPDPEPCRCCAEGRWDMCLNGGFAERGIQGLDGFGSERFLLEPEFGVRVDASLGLAGVLVEPTSIVTKAWRRVDAFAEVNCLEPRVALITGAGPIGLLAALLATQRDLEVHVLDRATKGPKPELVDALGATYHLDIEDVPDPDVVMECTGAPSLVFGVMSATSRNSIVCLTGVSEPAIESVDVGAINRELVLENHVVFGSVNASRDDYVRAVDHLVTADHDWLDNLITRRIPIDRSLEAYEKHDTDVKTVVTFEPELG